MKKNSIKILALSLIVVFLASCGGGGTSNNVFDTDLIPVKSGDEWQFIDKEGKIIINPQFSYATGFVDGVAKIKTTGDEIKVGYIDKEGKYKINASYIAGTIFSEGLACVVEENSEPKYINTDGEIIFTLKQAETAYIFSEGLALFSEYDEKEETTKYGFVDKEGQVAINPQFLACRSFSEGFAAFKNKDEKWGYIDKEGKIVINPQFDGVSSFRHGSAVVSNGESSGTIGTDGKFVINPQFDELSYFNEGLAIIKQNGKYGYVDTEGKIVINPQFDNASAFVNGLASVNSSGKWGYIDKEGKIVINPQFDFCGPFNDDFAFIVSGDKVGTIDKEGKYAINPQFDAIYAGILSKDYIRSQDLLVETDFFDVGLVANSVIKSFSKTEINGYKAITTLETIVKDNSIIEDDISRWGSSLRLFSDSTINRDASYSNTINFDSKLKEPIVKKVSNGWYSYNETVGYSINNEAKIVSVDYKIRLSGKGYGKGESVADAIISKIPSELKLNEEETGDDYSVYNSDKMSFSIYSGSNSVEIRIIFITEEEVAEDYTEEGLEEGMVEEDYDI